MARPATQDAALAATMRERIFGSSSAAFGSSSTLDLTLTTTLGSTFRSADSGGGGGALMRPFSPEDRVRQRRVQGGGVAKIAGEIPGEFKAGVETLPRPVAVAPVVLAAEVAEQARMSPMFMSQSARFVTAACVHGNDPRFRSSTFGNDNDRVGPGSFDPWQPGWPRPFTADVPGHAGHEARAAAEAAKNMFKAPRAPPRTRSARAAAAKPRDKLDRGRRGGAVGHIFKRIGRTDLFPVAPDHSAARAQKHSNIKRGYVVVVCLWCSCCCLCNSQRR